MSQMIEASETGLTIPTGSWGSENISASDILIPKLLLMQGLSEYVADGKAKMGDIVNSVSGAVLGGKEKPVEIIPVYHFRTLITMEEISGKMTFKNQEPLTLSNENLPWDDTVNGLKVRRIKSLNFYVLATEDLKAPGALPYLLAFRSTSYTTGRKLVNHFAQARDMNVPPAKTAFKLSSFIDKNEKGSFGVYDITFSRPSTTLELETAYKWFKIMSSSSPNVKVDESDLKKDVTSTTEF